MRKSQGIILVPVKGTAVTQVPTPTKEATHMVYTGTLI